MRRTLLTALLTIGLLASGLSFAAGSAVAATNNGTLAFGTGSGNIPAQEAAGVKPDYSTLWVGPWTMQNGWAGANDHMNRIQSEGVTPAIHLYYWGDDISPNCVEYGCWSDLHNTHKNKQEWQQLTQQLVDNLWATMGGDRVVIFLETEFNKGGIGDYEPFDDYLRDKVHFIKQHYPAAEIVIPFGNWRSWQWDTFDESAAAADYVGLQGMRGSTQDSWDAYHNLFEDTLQGVYTLQDKFGKSIFLHDIALSSFWEPDYLQPQANELREFFDGRSELKAAGVEAMIYRSWYDAPHADTGNYYGEAERHWGLAYPSSGEWKPAASVWVNGVQAERGGETTSSTDTSSTDATVDEYPVEFNPKSQDNPWWIEVDVNANPEPIEVEARIDGGSWFDLSKQDWGSWAATKHVPDGSTVEFRAISSPATGHHHTYSQEYTWGNAGTTSSGSTSDYSVDFKPKSQDNPWWIEVDAHASTEPAEVEARIDGGSWFDLQKKWWGSWALSKHVPDGSTVEFRAFSSSGDHATSQGYTWGDASAAGSGSTVDEYPVEFSPKSQGNDWWIEVDAQANPEPIEVEARINGGQWFDLEKQHWGSWALSKHVSDGSTVQFRAISSVDSGHHHTTSQEYTWG